MKTRERHEPGPVFPSVKKNIVKYRKNAFKITGKKVEKENNKPST